jgi:hypothetical protein
MRRSHHNATTARRMPFTSENTVGAIGRKRLRQAADKTKRTLQHSLDAVIGTEALARREITKHQAAGFTIARFGHIGNGCAAAWHVVPTSLPYCIGCCAAHARGGFQPFGCLAQPRSGTSAMSSPRKPPQASSTKARPNAQLTRAVPNPSFNASPNSWPGLPFLGHFGYRPIQVMPGQLSGPR